MTQLHRCIRKICYKKWIGKIIFVACLFICVWCASKAIAVIMSSSKVVDAFFVLGGSIQREIHVANLTKKNPRIPVLISQGSSDACVFNF